VVSFERDPDGYLLLNLNMPTVTEEPRLRVERNIWSKIGTPLDLECPPSGRRLRVAYRNGDSLSLDFRNLETAAEFRQRYAIDPGWQDLIFPVSALEINMNVAGRNLQLSPAETNLGAGIVRGAWMRGASIGIQIN